MIASTALSNVYGFITYPWTSIVMLAITGLGTSLVIEKAGFARRWIVFGVAPFVFGLLTILVSSIVIHSDVHGGGTGFATPKYLGFTWLHDMRTYLVSGQSRGGHLDVLYLLDAFSLLISWVFFIVFAFTTWPVKDRADKLEVILASRAPVAQTEIDIRPMITPRVVTPAPIVRPREVTDLPVTVATLDGPKLIVQNDDEAEPTVQAAPLPERTTAPLVQEDLTAPCAKCGVAVVVGREFFHECATTS